MSITCWAPECNHNNMRDTCRFYRFPKDLTKLKKWLKLIRRDGKPGTGSRLCSCHFRDGNKENNPDIFKHNEGKRFTEDYLTPEKKKPRKRRVKVNGDIEIETDKELAYEIKLEPLPDLSTSKNDNFEIETNKELADELELEPLPDLSILKRLDILEAENYLLKKEIEKLKQTMAVVHEKFLNKFECVYE